jgi:hypothetical protein
MLSLNHWLSNVASDQPNNKIEAAYLLPCRSGPTFRPGRPRSGCVAQVRIGEPPPRLVDAGIKIVAVIPEGATVLPQLSARKYSA